MVSSTKCWQEAFLSFCSSCREFWFGDEPAGDWSVRSGQPEPAVLGAHPAASPLSPWRPAAGRPRPPRYRWQIHRGTGDAYWMPAGIWCIGLKDIFICLVFSSMAAVWAEPLWTTTPSDCVRQVMKLLLLCLQPSLWPMRPFVSSESCSPTSSWLRGN